jgi:CRISPR system Cascade subunit CasC
MPHNTVGRFIDLHILQAVPYSNLNRDDTNSVKTVQYGGVNRTRVSSQSWKRAMRLEAQRILGLESIRTRRVAEAVETVLSEQRGWPTELAHRAGIHIVVSSSIGAEPPKKKRQEQQERQEDEVPWGTKAMVYVPNTAIDELADIAEEHRAVLEAASDTPDPKKDKLLPTDAIDAVLRSRDGIINLFGRMLAELDDAKVDGAVQVAHVLTTHETDSEVDYFSAVDDITAAWGDSPGSAHMGHAEYSAGTFYRYTTIDIADLLRNLGGDIEAARRLIEAFLEAVIISLPQAKKNSTAPHTFPDLIAIAVRGDRPYSYAAAFEKPITPARDGGYTAPSVDALDSYAAALAKLLGRRVPVHAAYAGTGAKELEHLGRREDSMDLLLSAALDAALRSGDQQ